MGGERKGERGHFGGFPTDDGAEFVFALLISFRLKRFFLFVGSQRGGEEAPRVSWGGGGDGD